MEQQELIDISVSIKNLLRALQSENINLENFIREFEIICNRLPDSAIDG